MTALALEQLLIISPDFQYFNYCWHPYSSFKCGW